MPGKTLTNGHFQFIAIISGLVIDTFKELYQIDKGLSLSGSGIIRLIYGASVAGLFLLGGILWRQKPNVGKHDSNGFVR